MFRQRNINPGAKAAALEVERRLRAQLVGEAALDQLAAEAGALLNLLSSNPLVRSGRWG